jgi:hypothetical protein
MSSEIEPVPHFSAGEISGEVRRSFDRLDGEVPEDYALFRGYINMGAGRSMRTLAERIGVGRERLQALSLKNSWVTRATEHDDEITRKALAELEGQGIEMRTRHAEDAKLIIEKAMEAVQHVRPEFMSPRDIPVWIDVATKLERSSRGVQDAAKRVEITGAGGGPIEVANAMTSEDRREMLARVNAEIAKRLAPPELDGEIVEGEIVDDSGESS